MTDVILSINRYYFFLEPVGLTIREIIRARVRVELCGKCRWRKLSQFLLAIANYTLESALADAMMVFCNC